MLKQRAKGDKSWPIACSDTTLGEVGKTLDLSGAHLSYGDFKEATFTGRGAIKLNKANLTHADLSGSKLTADDGEYESALIDFAGADLTNANLSGSMITANGDYDGSKANNEATIDFAEADLANADLSGSVLLADAYGDATIDFAEADLANADLSDSRLTADSDFLQGTIDFTDADLTNTNVSGARLTAKGDPENYGSYAGTIHFTGAILATTDLSGATLIAEQVFGGVPSPPPSPPRPPASPPGTFTTKASLQTALRAFNANPTAATATYGGPIADWDVSAITDMGWLFAGNKNFNADISNWDTSSVTTMSRMFTVRPA